MAFKVGDILLFDNNSFFSNVTNMFQMIKYGDSFTTHVGIISEVREATVVVHEALSSGFKTKPYFKMDLDRRLSDETLIIKRAKGLKNVKKNCDKYLGRGYSWFDIIRIGVTYVLGFSLAFGCSRHLICSEAVSRILYDASNKKINLSAEFKKPYDLITPMDIYYSKQLTFE